MALSDEGTELQSLKVLGVLLIAECSTVGRVDGQSQAVAVHYFVGHAPVEFTITAPKETCYRSDSGLM